MPDAREPDSVDMMMVVTGPLSAEDQRDILPFDAPDPDDLVVCAYLRTADDRKALLARLRRAAGEPPPAGLEPDDVTAVLAREYADLRDGGADAEALLRLVRWRAGVLRGTYHTYSLKDGVDPYDAAFVLAFRELLPEVLRYHVQRGAHYLQRDRTRVMDVFGWGVEGWPGDEGHG